MFEKRTRPLFSVVISCYNSGKYIGYLLDTLLHQGIRKDEYEIIISDDCSTEDYSSIVDKFRNKLNIKTVTSDHNWGYPSHTRQQGVEAASGEWIVFSDHDDGFFKDAFKQIKRYIKKYNCQHCIISGVMLGDFETKEPTEVINNISITHGVFFNKDNLWDKYGIKYNYKDIVLEEDHQIMTEIGALAHCEGFKIYIAKEIYTYCWFANNKYSISNNLVDKWNNGGRLVTESDLDKFIKSSIYVYNKMYTAEKIDYQHYMESLFHLYIRGFVQVNLYEFNNYAKGIENSDSAIICMSNLLKYIYSLMMKDDFVSIISSPEYLQVYDKNLMETKGNNGELPVLYPMNSFLGFIEKLENNFNNAQDPKKYFNIK